MVERIGLACLLWLCCAVTQAQSLVSVPPLAARVNDLSGVLSLPERSALESRLENFERETGTQLVVLTLSTTEPEAIEQFSIRVVDAWRLGRQGVDDGALLIVAVDDRAVRIETGRGLEGALTDLTSRRIIQETILPKFREGDYPGGITAGVERMMLVASGEPLPPPAKRWDADTLRSKNFGTAFWGELVIAALFAVFVGSALLRNWLGRLPGSLLTGALTGSVGALLGVGWLIAMLLGVSALVLALLFSVMPSDPSALGRHRGPWGGAGGFGGGFGGGGFRGGGGGFRGGAGGFGGGGFRGGGGGFGGGGASGRW